MHLPLALLTRFTCRDQVFSLPAPPLILNKEEAIGCYCTQCKVITLNSQMNGFIIRSRDYSGRHNSWHSFKPGRGSSPLPMMSCGAEEHRKGYAAMEAIQEWQCIDMTTFSLVWGRRWVISPEKCPFDSLLPAIRYFATMIPVVFISSRERKKCLYMVGGWVVVKRLLLPVTQTRRQSRPCCRYASHSVTLPSKVRPQYFRHSSLLWIVRYRSCILCLHNQR